MLDTAEFGRSIGALGYRWGTGVPCSYLENLINYASNHLRYFAAVNEGDAVALASGAEVGGVKTAVLMQNSGLTNATSPLTSLNSPFRIPLLGFVSLRGQPGIPDEPQHELTGRITTQMLELMEIPWAFLPDDQGRLQEELGRAGEAIGRGDSFFFVVRKGTFGPEQLQAKPHPPRGNVLTALKQGKDQLPTRYQALEVINTLKDAGTAQIVTTGKAGRELFTIEDAPNNLYMVGSMGCAGPFGLGVSLARREKKVVVIDGDGALLMRMGSLAMNGHYGGDNFLHILLDNQAYESTGGQHSISHNVDFVSTAAACGYAKACYIHSLDQLKDAVAAWQAAPSLSFLQIRISEGSLDNLGRPTVKPHEVKERFMDFLRSN